MPAVLADNRVTWEEGGGGGRGVGVGGGGERKREVGWRGAMWELARVLRMTFN